MFLKIEAANKELRKLKKSLQVNVTAFKNGSD